MGPVATGDDKVPLAHVGIMRQWLRIPLRLRLIVKNEDSAIAPN